MLAGYVLAPVAVTMTLAAFLAVGSLERQIERRLQEDVELVARSIQRPLARDLERGRPGAVQNALDSAFRIDRVFGAYIYDADGNTVASAGAREPPTRQRQLTELAADGERRGEFGEVGGREVYSYFVPLADSSGRVSALLQVTRRASDFDAYIRKLRRQAGGLLVLTWVLVGGLVLFGHRRAIGGPLARLLGSMERVREGERGHRADAVGPREISRLALGLNGMLDGISEAEEEIEARRRQEELLRAELRHSERLAAIGRLAAGVAHELGTPLSVIAGRAERALRKTRPGDSVRSALEGITAQVDRMERVVRQLLDFGRREAPDRTRVAAFRLCRAAVGSVKEAARDLDVDLQPDPPEEETVLELDAASVERTLINLLHNAIQAAPGGTVRMTWGRRSPGLRIAVDDSGPGVPPSLRERIFEPFFTTKGPHGGTGLGLAVAHGLARGLGGSLRVSDSPLGGARFEVLLPASSIVGPGEGA